MAAGDGLVSMTPTSIAHAGTSAVINSDGGVDFSAVTSLSLNGVFTSEYDNYVIVARHSSSTDGILNMFLRASGSDATTAADYNRQRVTANNTSITALRTTGALVLGNTGASLPNGTMTYVYGPALAQPTAARSVTVTSENGAYFIDYASTHTQSIAYDGFSVNRAAGITGNIHVFGYEE